MPAFHGSVPVVLNRILCAAWKKSCDFRPFGSIDAVCVNDRAVFLHCPAVLYNVRVEMVMSAFSALLANAPRQERSNE